VKDMLRVRRTHYKHITGRAYLDCQIAC